MWVQTTKINTNGTYLIFMYKVRGFQTRALIRKVMNFLYDIYNLFEIL